MSGADRREHNPDDPAHHQAPPPLGELLGRLRHARGWSKRLEGAQVHGRWEEIVGAELARHVTPVRLHGGVLVVRASSTTWATQVRYLSGEIAARTNAVLGPDAVRSVTVVTGAGGGR